MSKIPVFVCCLFLSACNLDQGLDSKYQIGVREDIILDMNQVLSPEVAELDFVFTSISSDHCEGSSYNHQTDRSQSDISIHLINLTSPKPCMGDTAPALQQIPITTAMGTFGLSIDLGDLIHNKGSLYIDQKGYHLVMNSQFGMVIRHDEMLRIPVDAIWGYVYHHQNQPQALSKVLELMEPYSGNLSLQPGYYGHFTSLESNEITLPLPQHIKTASPFILRYNTDPSFLSNLANEIRNQLPQDTEFKLFTWLGTSF